MLLLNYVYVLIVLKYMYVKISLSHLSLFFFCKTLLIALIKVFALVDALVSRLPFRLSNEKNIVEETIDLFFFHVYTYMYTCAYVHVLFK